MTDHEQPAAEVALKPKFGDMVENGWASEENPTRRGFFVREFRRTGRMNAGLTWEITDGNGKFWEFKPSDIAEEGRLTVTPSRAPTDAGGAVSDLLKAEHARVKATAYNPGTPAEIQKVGILRGLTKAIAIAMVAEDEAALTPAPQAEGEAFEFPYQRTFDAIADAVTQRGGGLGISVEAFQRSFNASGPAPQPLQQGGEVTRAAVIKALEPFALLAGYGDPENATVNLSDPIGKWLTFAQLHDAASVMNALRSLAADRDKAGGLLREVRRAGESWLAPEVKRDADAFLSSQTEGR